VIATFYLAATSHRQNGRRRTPTGASACGRRVATLAMAVLALVFGSSGAVCGGDTVDVDQNTFPWSSVGKIYNGSRSSCTGSVIASDKVLTAAHCLFSHETSRFLSADSLHFLLGYRGGEYPSHSVGTSYVLGAGYKPQGANRSVIADWAIITVAKPITSGTTPLALAKKAPAAGERIMVGGFRRDTRLR
jgi:protease YdgD